MQDEQAPAGPVFGLAYIRAQNLVGQLCREFLVALFLFGEIAEQPADPDILRALTGLGVEPLGLQLHRLDLLADGVERQILGQPDRAPAQKSFDVLASDRRQMRSETLLIQFQQPMAMAALLLGHLFEYLGGVRITLREVLGEAHIDAAIFFL